MQPCNHLFAEICLLCAVHVTDEEMLCTLRVQKTMQISSMSQWVSAAHQGHTDGATHPVTIPDYSVQNSHLRCEWELHAGSMQLLTAEQALAAAASGSAVVHAVCAHQR